MSTGNRAAAEGSAARSLTRVALELVGLSFVVLFQELALIRWLPSQVRVLAYFPNLILISAFLGLGLGCLRAGKRSLLWLWPVAIVALVGSAFAMSGVVFTHEGVSEVLWLFYYDLEDSGAPIFEGVRLPIVWSFVASALTFVALGQLVAERLREFRRRSSSLWGYAWDILGSLLGVICFSIGSFLGLFPIVWFTVIAGLLAPFFWRRRWLTAGFVVGVVALLGLVSAAEKAELYSPYYALSTTVDGRRPGFSVMTNGALHQAALPLSRSDTHELAGHRQWMRALRRDFHRPYRLLKEIPRRGLVLGAGTGNDVATMLDEEVREVTAVEIDPFILELGRANHPNQPYSDPRVRIINDDARQFLERTDEEFDLIVFGTMDSLTRLSALSSVRLDNFIYTQESFNLAAKRLAPGGGLVVLFGSEVSEFIRERIVVMLYRAFDEPPRVEPTSFYNHAMFFAGEAFADLEDGPARVDMATIERILAEEQVPHDDWPFLYLRERGVTGFYASLMVLFAVIALGLVVLTSSEMRRSLRRGRGVDLEMFLFGLAFLLLETRSVTQMNLVFGSTWLTTAIVFGSILLMVLLGTIAMALRPLPWWLSAAGLVLSLVAVTLLPASALLGLEGAARLVASGLYVGAPIFFASTCFALRFKERERPDAAFGWNLLGAVAGGLVEFFSMALGLRAMLLVALAAYLGVLLLRSTSLDRALQRRAGLVDEVR